jgi:hypothetical protein
MKVVFPTIWTILFGEVVGSGARYTAPDVGVLLFWIAGAGLMWWHCARLKVVHVDDNFLYVSNFLKEIAVPLSDICDVTESLWSNVHPVTIHLKSPSEFGNKIVFMPTHRMFAFFSSHPVVDEIKRLARLNGGLGLLR